MGPEWVGGTSGVELARAFWLEVVAPALEQLGVAGGAAALLGPGSEVLGFDDIRSTDHDMGPRLQVLLPDDRAGEVDRIRRRLDPLLPDRFGGFPVRFPTTVDPAARHRVEITTVEDLFGSICGLDPRQDLSVGQWLRLPTQILSSATSGAVFADPSGELTAARTSLAWYPDDVWRYVLGCQWRRLAQREPFLGRTAEVGDDLGSRLVAAGLARDLMRLAFLIERRWAPYEKWLGSAFAGLDAAPALRPHLDLLLGAPAIDEREMAYLAAGVALAERFSSLGLVDPIDTAPRRFHDRPSMVLGADRYADACVLGSGLAHHGWRGAIDQWVDNTDVVTAPSTFAALGAVALDQPCLDAGPLLLRPFAPGDLDAVREASDDPSIPAITTVPTPFTEARGRAFIARQQHRAAGGEGWAWAVARVAEDRQPPGTAIGQVGLWPKGDGRASIGYWVVASARGEGVAVHAVDAVCRFAFETVGLERLELLIAPGNTGSIRTAERCGFAQEGLVRSALPIGDARQDLWMYGRLRARG